MRPAPPYRFIKTVRDVSLEVYGTKGGHSLSIKSGTILWVEQYIEIHSSTAPSEENLRIHECFPILYLHGQGVVDHDMQNTRVYLEKRQISKIKESLFWKIWEARRSDLPTRYVRIAPTSIFYNGPGQTLGKWICSTDDAVRTVVISVNGDFKVIDRHDLEFVKDEEGDTAQVVDE
jgi:hypothetical protein